MKTTSILFIFALLIAACSEQEATPDTIRTISDQATQSLSVKTMKVSPSTTPLPIHATGTLASSSEIKLSFKIPGIVSAIYVEEGQKVRKGQVLARINPTEINAQVRQAEIGLEKAERDLERAEALYKDTVITLEQLQDLQSARDAASTQVEIAGYNRDNAVIISNVNGRVLKRFAEKGEMVGAGVPVLYVASGIGQQVVRSSLADRDVITVNLGDPAAVFFDAWPGQRFEAEVSEIAATADSRTGAFDVELLLKASEHKLLNGFVGRLDIFPKNQQAYLAIPIDAVVDADEDRISVFAANASRNKALRMQWNQYELGDSFVYVPIANDASPVELIVSGARSLRADSPIVCEEIDAIQAQK